MCNFGSIWIDSYLIGLRNSSTSNLNSSFLVESDWVICPPLLTSLFWLCKGSTCSACRMDQARIKCSACRMAHISQNALASALSLPFGIFFLENYLDVAYWKYTLRKAVKVAQIVEGLPPYFSTARSSIHQN